MSSHLQVVKGNDIYLIHSQTANYHNLDPKIRPLSIETRVQANVSSSQLLAIISNNQ